MRITSLKGVIPIHNLRVPIHTQHQLAAALHPPHGRVTVIHHLAVPLRDQVAFIHHPAVEIHHQVPAAVLPQVPEVVLLPDQAAVLPQVPEGAGNLP